MSSPFIPFQSIAATRRLLRSKEISPVELIEGLGERIRTIDPKIGAYIEHDLETAKKEALNSDLSKPLGGIPIGIKDAITVKGQPCQSASRILDGFTAPYDSTAVARLRAAGGIPFGRMNMDEFAMGSSTENSAFHPTRNPWSLDRIPGGFENASKEPVNISDGKIMLPPKNKVLSSMEELIHQFMLVTQGVNCPPGEIYFGAENPKGELGFYINSRGGGTPYRMKIRAPSFVNLSILPAVLPGHMMSDVVAILGSIDFVMGECDR
jgi:hypothetical protein